MNKEIAPITGPIDAGIKLAVDLLRNDGINTVASCQGKHAHDKELPWIAVDPIDFGVKPTRITVRQVRSDIMDILLHHGFHGFTISEEYLYQKNPWPWKAQLRITFWGKAEPQ